MNNLLQQQLDEVLMKSAQCATRDCERALRVGAAALSGVPVGEITAATVVCNVAEGDIDAVELLVSAIADEYGLEALVQQQPTSYSVRFSWPQADEPSQAAACHRSLLSRVLGRRMARHADAD